MLKYRSGVFGDAAYLARFEVKQGKTRLIVVEGTQVLLLGEGAPWFRNVNEAESFDNPIDALTQLTERLSRDVQALDEKMANLLLQIHKVNEFAKTAKECR